MSRFARDRRVFFFEEPVFEDCRPHLRTSICPATGVVIQIPVLPHGLEKQEITAHQRKLLTEAIQENVISDCVLWYYTPMAHEFASDLNPAVTVYDCMDELSAFRGAPPAMVLNEELLFADADLVFTGGSSLFESKRKQHKSVHLFPSSVDVSHFAQAFSIASEPTDQASIGQPRFGYAGVIDERMDLELIRRVAAERPQWHFVFIGPVVKIDPQSLPTAPNIHYMGMKQYSELPSYMSGWSVGILPFALNESTRFISPTKTPEYLAAGLKVISSAIRDVVTPYSDLGLVEIANSADEFVAAGERLLSHDADDGFRQRTNQFLSRSSWDKTWSEMNRLIQMAFAEKHSKPSANFAEMLPFSDVYSGKSNRV